MQLTITPLAERFIRRIVRFGGGTVGHGLRLTVTPGGCSGLSSEFTVEAAPQAGDTVVDVHEVKLFLPPASRQLLEGGTIDFLDSAMESGFRFVTAHSEGACCGGSHAGAVPGMATFSVASIQRKP